MRVLATETGSCCAQADDGTFLAVFRGRNGTRNIVSMQQALVAYAKARQSTRVLVVIEPGSPLGARGRDQIAVMMTQVQGLITAWATVIEGTGFWASASRAIAAGVRLASRSSFNLQIFSTVEAGLAWLAEQTRQPVPPALREDVAAARRQLDVASVSQRS